MKLLLSDSEQENITGLFKDIRQSSSLKEFLIKYIGRISSLLQTEYNAVMMFSSGPVPQHISLDNNPGSFNKAYADELIFKDQFLDHLFASENNHHFLSRFSVLNHSINDFIEDCNSLRPTGDCYYGTLRFRGRILGMAAFTLPRKRGEFDERQRQILSLVQPALDSGVLTHMMRDKIDLMGKLRLCSAEFSYFFIYENDLTIEIPGESNPLLIEQIFQLRTGDPAGRNLILSCLVERLLSSADFPSRLCEVLYWGNVPYTLRLFRKCEGPGQRNFSPIILATIEKDKESYSFESFSRIHSLTPRENDVLKEIIKGCSNKQISKNLFISLATVKKHNANIFEKTGCRSRTQLFFALSSCSRTGELTSVI